MFRTTSTFSKPGTRNGELKWTKQIDPLYFYSSTGSMSGPSLQQPTPSYWPMRTLSRSQHWPRAAHIKSKTRTLNDCFRLFRPFLTSKNIKLPTKLLLYKLLLRPIWSYGLQLWGSAKVSNTNRIQRFQSKVLRVISKAPYYVSNNTLHSDFNQAIQ